jgi:hypothetical protein
LENYNKIAKNIKRRLFSVSNTQNIKMDKKEVPIDPYVFGVWLGDGDHNGHGFTTIDDEVVKAFALWADTINAEITHNNNSGRDDCYHYEIRRKGSGKLVSIGDKENSSITCKACINSKFNHPSCDWVFEKCEPVIQYGVTQNGQKRWDLNPFKEILKKNNLYKNKFIPDCYINNDEETRLQVLAGFIDTDGHLTNNNIGSPSYEISQSKRLHSELIEKISIIAQSLGFATSITYIKKNTTTKKGEDMTMIIVRIFGDIERIPCRIPRKKITNNTRIKHSMHYSPFTVEHVGKGKFCGWQVDKNERFLLGNYTVTHNSRLQGGSDSASERYIFTHLTDVARAIFPEADDQVLTYINDDGTLVEPEFYVPIIPFVLVNGQKGIGTGFSTSIPSYNPLDLIQYLRAQLTATAATQPDLLPYYEEFQGTVARISPSKYLIKGVYEKTAEDRIIIRELPIGTWTMPYITFLEELLDPAPDKAGKKVTPAIKDFANMSTESIVQIHVQFPRGALAALEAATDEDGCNGVHKLLKLTTTVSTTNMNLFTEELKLKKYETPEEIIADYFPVRMDAYVRRKKYLLENLEQKLLKMTNKARYIQAVLDDVIDLRRKTNQQVDDMLSAAQFDRIEDSFKYLTKLPMDSVSKENVAAILRDKEETEREFETLKNTTEKQMWAAELDELEQKYMSYRTARRAKHTEDGGAGDGVAQKKKARTIKIKA